MTLRPTATIARRVIGIVALSLAGFVAMAAPMIYSEIHSSVGIWGMRFGVGLICGAIGAPMLVAAAWGKRMLPAVALIFMPPTAAAVLAAMSWSDDYSFTHIAVPLSYVTMLLTFVVLPDRDRTDGGRRCPICGYDLRATPAGRCPECGGDPRSTRRRSTRPRQTLIGLAWLLASMAVSGAGHTVFLGWLLSLG